MKVGVVDQVKNAVEYCVLKPGDEIVAINPLYFRPTEGDLLLGDPTKAQAVLGWKRKHDVNSPLLREMVDADLDLMRKDTHLKEGGIRVQ